MAWCLDFIKCLCIKTQIRLSDYKTELHLLNVIGQYLYIHVTVSPEGKKIKLYLSVQNTQAISVPLMNLTITIITQIIVTLYVLSVCNER